MSENKVALITGAAKRVGAAIARLLHQQGMNIIIHYHTSHDAASQLVQELNAKRENSATMLAADLNQINECENLIKQAEKIWQRLDVLVNNASRFYPTLFGEVEQAQWQDLFASNLQAPFFLAQMTAPFLKKQRGCIINVTDIHAEKPLKNYAVYCLTKAGLSMLTKVLAKELAPEIRVNAVAPGAVCWPEGVNELTDEMKHKIVEQTLLKRAGTAQDIAKAVKFFIDNDYITGQSLAVDGGRGG